VSDEALDTISDIERLALSALTEALDGITSDIVDARTYSGPEALHYAQNQAQRELVTLLVDLARAKRSESLE
jgi:hypothetical protein